MVGFIIISVALVIITGATPEEWKQWWNGQQLGCDDYE